MTRPDHPPAHVERHDLAVAKPGVHALAVGHRCRRRQVVLLVKIGVRARRAGLVLPHPLAVRSPERLDDEPDRGRIPIGTGAIGLRTSAANRGLALGERAFVARQLGMPASVDWRAADLRGDDDAIAPDDGRRVAEPCDRRAPGQVLVRAPRRRQTGLLRHAPTGRAAPLRPVFSRELDSGQDESCQTNQRARRTRGSPRRSTGQEHWEIGASRALD